MSSHPEPTLTEKRVDELLADKAVFGLSSDEAQELAKLISLTDKKDDESFERATAAIDLSLGKVDPMPETLSRKLREQGREAMQGSHSESSASGSVISSVELASKAERPQRVNEIIAWASALAIGFIGLWIWTDARSTNKKLKESLAELNGRLNSLEQDNVQLVAANTVLQEQITPDGEKIYRTLANRDDVIRWNWTSTGKSQGAGDVVWDEESQTGAMRFVNLEVNDPTTQQYQLWIIEANGREHPVDGGVFNVDREGEIYVPIDAKLFAKTPAAFAITVEDPSGVVVSKQGNLPLVAKAPADQ